MLFRSYSLFPSCTVAYTAFSAAPVVLPVPGTLTFSRFALNDADSPDRVGFRADYALGAGSGGINPAVQPVTIEKLRWLLSKATAAFGNVPISELQPAEIAAWRMTIPRGYRFEATQALRQTLARAVSWGMINTNPAKEGVENPKRPRV